MKEQNIVIYLVLEKVHIKTIQLHVNVYHTFSQSVHDFVSSTEKM